MNTAIVILGSPNDEKGKLLSIAIERCEQAFIEHQKIPLAKLLCTGGFGEQFNTTDTPHAQYIQQYLLNKNVPVDNFLPQVMSRFTLEDALLSVPVIEQFNIDHIILVTSDFHMARAKYIFSMLMPNISLECAEALTNKTTEEMQRLSLHEKKALARDRMNLSLE